MRLISMRMVRAVAAAAVVALSACTTSQPPAVSVPSSASPSPPGGQPAYYVVVAGLNVVVRASADGHVTGSVAIPVPAGTARAYAGGEVFGGLDDRHFVIVVSRGGDLPGVSRGHPVPADRLPGWPARATRPAGL